MISVGQRVRHALFRAILVAVGTAGLALRAQPPAAISKFDVASVKPCSQGDGADNGGRGGGRGLSTSPGRLNVTCMTVADLINVAYVQFGKDHPLANDSAGLFDAKRLKGGPAWAYSSRYSIEAKADGCTQYVIGTPYSDLSLAPGGKPWCTNRSRGNGRNWMIESAGQDLSGLARVLSETLPPVYAEPSVPQGQSVFTALEQQLGLKLLPDKGPHGVIVIDSVDRPTGN